MGALFRRWFEMLSEWVYQDLLLILGWDEWHGSRAHVSPKCCKLHMSQVCFVMFGGCHCAFLRISWHICIYIYTCIHISASRYGILSDLVLSYHLHVNLI